MALRSLLLFAVLPLSGCAAVLGTAISPITVPVDVVRSSPEGWQWKHSWQLPLAVILAPFLGFMCGLETDSRMIDPGWEWPLHHILRPIKYMPGH